MIFALILASILSEFVDTGDFPITDWDKTQRIQPKFEDKNAIVAMCAAWGELYNGMHMDFDVDHPLRGTPLESYSNLVTQAKAGTMNRSLVEGNMLRALNETVCEVFGRGYGHDYGDVEVLGVATNMNLTVNPASTVAVCEDVCNAACSNMKNINGIDYALFRDMGERATRTTAISDSLRSAYSQVFGLNVPVGTYGEMPLENGVAGYGFTSYPWGEEGTQSAVDCAWWMAGILDDRWQANPQYAYRQLFYAPMTWFNAPWCVQHLGMVMRWPRPHVLVETRETVHIARAKVHVEHTAGDEYYEEYSAELVDSTATDEVTVTTNAVLAENLILNNRIDVYPMLSVSLPVIYTARNYREPNVPRYVVGEPYEVVTNGQSYWAQHLWAGPCVATNAADEVYIPIEYKVVSVTDRVVDAYGAQVFPLEQGKLKVQAIVHVEGDGDAFDDTPLGLDYKGVAVYQGDGTNIVGVMRASIIPQIMEAIGERAKAEIETHHVYDTRYDEGELTSFQFPHYRYDEVGYPFDPEIVWAWKGGPHVIDEGVWTTKDWENFSTGSPLAVVFDSVSFSANDEPPFHWTEEHYGEQDWSMETEVDAALFGFWKFTRWAHE